MKKSILALTPILFLSSFCFYDKETTITLFVTNNLPIESNTYLFNDNNPIDSFASPIDRIIHCCISTSKKGNTRDLEKEKVKRKSAREKYLKEKSKKTTLPKV